MSEGEAGTSRLAGVFLGPGPRPLRLLGTEGGAVACLSPETLNRRVVERWLRRLQIPSEGAAPASRELPGPLVRLDTQVVCCDPRVFHLAELFAQATAAPLRQAKTPAGLARAIQETERSSVTIFLLNDRLDEPLCHAVSRANRRRGAAGRAALPYGFMTAFTPEHIAWLVVKTLVLLCGGGQRGEVGFSLFDGVTGTISTRFRHARTGRTCRREIAEPWSSEAISVLGVHSHGVSFDVQIGPIALCSHLDPPLPPGRLAHAPVCFHDGTCFRLGRSDGVAARFPAAEATPLVWWLNSCAAVPFAQSAFGSGTGYVYGLLAGAATGVVGPYLTLPSTGWLNTLFEGLLATGATLGEAAAAMSQAQDPAADFDPYLVLGSPDLRLLPAAPLLPEWGEEPLIYRVRGPGRWALRLAVPPQLEGPVAILGDDGGEAWETAACQLVGPSRRRELLVVLEGPADLEGWLRLGRGGKDATEIGAEVEEILRRLEVLAHYPFLGEAPAGLAACRDLAQRLLALLRLPNLLRGRLFSAVLLTLLQEQLNRLQEEASRRFIDHVVAHDFSFDRESSNGFVAGALRRSGRRCPMCGAALYTAFDSWNGDRSYRRRKDVCANCIGISMVLERSPLLVEAAGMELRGGDFHVGLRLTNRTTGHARVWITGVPRHGPFGAASGPHVLDLRAGEDRVERYAFAVGDKLGVISYRFLVLCQGAAELHSFKHDNVRRGGLTGGSGVKPPPAAGR